MANKVNISAKWLQGLKSPATGRAWYSDTALPHFALCATHTGARIFYRVGRINGRMTRVRIGTSPEITVKVARDICTELNGEVAAGKDIRSKRRKTTGQHTLKDAWEWFRDYHARPNKRTWKRDESAWNRDLKHWGSRTLDSILRSEVIELMTKVSHQPDRGPGAGKTLLDLIRGIFHHAIINDWTTHDPTTRIKKPRSKQRTRFLSATEVPAFFQSLMTFRERIQDFFLLCIYTGARRSNVMAMRWDELDRDGWVWVIPVVKAKAKREIILPLSRQVIQILERRYSEAAGSPWVFPSTASKSGHYEEPKDAWRRIISKAGLNDVTIHDLRRTLASWQAALGVSLPIIGKSLGHSTAAATQIYARLGNEPVRNAVQNAIDAIENAVAAKKSEKS